MALIKSRIIGHHGRDDLPQQLQSVIPGFIKKYRDPDLLAQDVAAMRTRVQAATKTTASRIDIRSSDGGIIDIDFLTQMMQLMPAAKDLPIHRKSADATASLADIGLFTEAEAAAIHNATQFYSDAIQLMRLLDMKVGDDRSTKGKFPELLKKRFNINSFTAFSEHIESVAKPISSMMKKYVSKA